MYGLYGKNGLVYDRNRRALGYFRYGTSGIVLSGTIESGLLSAEDAGTDVCSRYNRQCRIWIYLRSLYADFQLWRGTPEIFVLPSKHLRYLYVEESYDERGI